jgi:2-oxoglutarate ferredoxin oxidoreductase subunit beta
MIFGKDRDKGLILRGTSLEVVTIGKNGISEKDILIHDKHQRDTGIHVMLAKMGPPVLPMAFGVIRSVIDFTFESKMEQVIQAEMETNPIKSVDHLLNSGKTWEI